MTPSDITIVADSPVACSSVTPRELGLHMGNRVEAMVSSAYALELEPFPPFV